MQVVVAEVQKQAAEPAVLVEVVMVEKYLQYLPVDKVGLLIPEEAPVAVQTMLLQMADLEL